MKIFIKVFCLLFVTIILSGCVPTKQEVINKYFNQPASELCYNYYRYPAHNDWQPYRAAVINKRGLDCSPWKAAGLKKRNRDAKWMAIGNALSTVGNAGKAMSNTTGSSTSSGFTKVCNYKGTGGYSALVVSATSICPSTHSSNISGFTKVCRYPNAIGGPKAITVSSTAICPVKYN